MKLPGCDHPWQEDCVECFQPVKDLSCPAGDPCPATGCPACCPSYDPCGKDECHTCNPPDRPASAYKQLLDAVERGEIEVRPPALEEDDET